MSLFLAPIHHWLFNKIRLVEQREELTFQLLEGNYSEQMREIRSEVWQNYPEPWPAGKDLAELIDTSNIHGWLSGRVADAEMREAAVVKKAVALLGDEAKQLITQAFIDHGSQCGVNAREKGKYQLDTAEGIYRALNDYLLNGMPCDQSHFVEKSVEEEYIWVSDVCLPERSWNRVAISPKLMNELYQKWVKAFVEAANAKYTYKKLASIVLGDGEERQIILRK